MQLVEKHCIGKHDPRFATIDDAAFRAKSVYNAANYLVRQSFIQHGVYLNYATIFHQIKTHEAYQALPRKVSNDVLRLLDTNWKSFFKAVKAYTEDPSKFLGRPKLPRSKEKDQHTILIYDKQALSIPALKQGIKLGITPPTKQTNVKQVRMVPCGSHYVIEVVYEQETKLAAVNSLFVAGIDIGLNNLATLTSNQAGFTPMLVNGRPVKSINQWYNKEHARPQSQLSKHKRHTSIHLVE